MSPTDSRASAAIDQVRIALDEFQAAIRALIGARIQRTSGDAVRGIDLVNHFGIDLKLAWKIGRIQKSDDPFACVRYLPGVEGMRIFCSAALAKGAPSALVEAVRSGFDSVRREGLAWAGDSRAFELMAAGLALVGDPRVGLAHRKNHFLSGSYVWGIRANTLLRMDLLHPAADGKNIEMATVRGFIGVERLRMDAPWYLEVPFCVDDAAKRPMDVIFEPIDEGDKGRGAPFLMKRFCSKDMPKFAPPVIDRVPRVVELPVGAVGVECRFDLFHGALVHGAMPAHRSPDNEVACLMMKVQTPCERAIFDLWIHRDLIPTKQVPIGSMFSVLDGWRGQFSHQNRDRIPIDFEVQEVPDTKRKAPPTGFAQMAELVDSTFARAKYDRSEFRHFNAEVVYPPVPSTMTIDVKLPE